MHANFRRIREFNLQNSLYLFFPQYFANFRMFRFTFFNKNETTMKTKGENKEGGCIWLREKYGLKLIKFQKERENEKKHDLSLKPKHNKFYHFITIIR